MIFFRKIIIACLGLFLFSCVGEFKEISVSNINGLKINKLTEKGIEADINVSIKNPNNVAFKVYKSKADVYIGESKLGTARIVKRVKIAANSSVEETFTLRGDLKNVSMGSLPSILMGKSPAIEIKGYLKAGKWFYKKKFPIDQHQKISGNSLKGLFPGF